MQAILEKRRDRASAGYLSVYAFAALMVLLLFARDVLQTPIPKYALLVLVLGALWALDHRRALVLYCFLMPLYVGLPGNFITLGFLLKQLAVSVMHKSAFRLTSGLFLLTLFSAVFLLAQNLLTGYLSVYNMIPIAELFLLLFLLSHQEEPDLGQMLLMYLFGVASLGIIMLSATLREHSVADLLTSAARLGTASVRTAQDGAMSVYVDPNYYGLFVIAAVSAAYGLLGDWRISVALKSILISLGGVCILIGTLALSRAFVLVLLLWVALIFWAKKGFRKMIVFPLLLALTVALFNALLPGVLEGVWERFQEANILTGNGRTSIIATAHQGWTATTITLLFGYGLFNCHVHCMQLQYLYGTGLVGSGLMLAFSWSLYRSVRRKLRQKPPLASYIPMAVVALMAATVPIANSLTFMFPVVIALYAFQMNNEVRHETSG